MHKTVHLAGIAALMVTACSPAPAPVSQSMQDPSNPAAREGKDPPAAASAAPLTSSRADDAHAGHDHGGAASSTAPGSHAGHEKSSPAADGGAAGVAYTCPMHPEVVSDRPSVCPKCNMKLVVKK